MTSSLPPLSELVGLFPEDTRGPAYNLAYVYAGVALLAFAQEKKTSYLWQEIANAHATDESAQATVARRLREGLLKASPLVGFPRSINGLSALLESTRRTSPTLAASLEQDASLRSPVPKAERQQRGKAFFSRIYAQHTDRVLHAMNASSGGDLGEFAITCIYGDLMAEESILDAKETGLLEFVACFACQAERQAKGHMYGARNLGASGKEITGTVDLVIRVAKALGVDFDIAGMEFVEKAKGW
ncbi:uncharacterized protein K452DRAFT_233001 [Aplosporella prunicola CBS 121167]|uniref:Carboxymuconolactone decarboxylase-like domain-containing protein n=1 Tax=Aplosporella prunicola CBS 121167 TaxID=1176127 RepID=A0A6A6B6N7_9PEZI|nr:uncharacterized protein K452DRAFT_233001 [Aplosporella prunicola CBS 121167]KAF2139063.1 hypothetical protein K452DRAFT_233001 [Aplosporella prunicola CBS 121167]